MEIFNDLPQQLQNQVATHLTNHILHKTPIIKEIPADARALMASKLRPITIGVGEDICEQGEDADRLWILQSGESMPFCLAACLHACNAFVNCMCVCVFVCVFLSRSLLLPLSPSCYHCCHLQAEVPVVFLGSCLIKSIARLAAAGVMVAMYGRVTKSDIAEAPCLIGETTILQDVDPEFERRPCSYRATEICNLCVAAAPEGSPCDSCFG